MSARETSTNLGQLLKDFFLKHLSTQRGASPRTIESYRDAFRLLFRYCESERQSS